MSAEANSGPRASVSLCLAAIGAALLVGCTPEHRSATDGVLVFDDEVTLERGKGIDSARRELAVDGAATFVAIVEESDVEVTVRVSHQGAADGAPASVEVDSYLLGAGIEIATLDAPRGSRLTVLVESGQDFNVPTKVRLKVRRFDARSAANPGVPARVAAYRAWSAATGAQLGGDELRDAAVRHIDAALAYFEGSGGDAALAAWGRVVRARINNRQFAGLDIALRDIHRAVQAFDAIGAARNAGRARMLEADTLLDISSDAKAKDPSADDAAREALKLLTALAIDPALSPFERARATNYLGVHAFNVYDWPRARATWQAVLRVTEAMGDRLLRRQVLENLGVLANEEGDPRTATTYFDQVIDEIDQIVSVEYRIVLLYNAAGIDINAGNLDRAIERLLKALELTRQQKLPSNEARVLHGLGRAYRARGDNAQAAALLGEGLKLRRTLNDANGLIASLRQYGSLARDAGDFDKALALHGEADSLANSPDTRVRTLLDLATDYTAASDYRRAIAASREALAVRVVETDSNKLNEGQLALAEALLSQPRPTPKAVAEGATLAQSALASALLRADATMEFSARRLLAQSQVARGDLQKAQKEYERAIALVFSYRSKLNNPDLQAAALIQEQKTFRGYVDVLMISVARRGPNKLLAASATEEQALRTLEWARALNFDSSRFAQFDTASQARLDELLTQMAGKRVRIAALLERTADSAREIEILQLDIAKLRAEVDRLRASAHGIARLEANSALGTPPWPILPSGVTQLAYAIQTDKAYVWVRDASGIRTTMLAATPDTIARELAGLATAIRARAPDQVEATLSRVSAALLPAGVLATDSGTLEIVAEGQIASVPFSALRTPRAPSIRLAERGPIVMIGSLFEARARPRLARPHPLGFVALANDARSGSDASAAQVFPALNNTGAEVRAIASLFQRREPAPQVRLLLGAEGSAVSLKKTWEGGVDVIHFATHGLADQRQPLASLLLLPALDATGAPTYLTAGQVQEWRGDADLVYLSACETAVGPGRFAEGLPGLQRAFLRAGAHGVVATLWPVEDVYASQFATDFYRRFAAGMPASQALSETQRDWMKPAPEIRDSDLPYRRMTAWAHAYYAQ